MRTRTPKSVRRITDPNEDVHRTIENFFLSIRAELLAKGISNDPEYFRMDIRNLSYPEAGSYGRQSDDMLHIFKYKDRVIALVAETRTQTNYVQFDFFKNLEGLLKQYPPTSASSGQDKLRL